MSWSYNNPGVDAVQMWTNNAAGYSSKGDLVVNGVHQVIVTVGITFTESTPTQQELGDALFFIDNNTGEPVTLFKSSTTAHSPAYLTLYNNPSSAATTPDAPAPIASTVPEMQNYQCLIDFYLSSAPADNPDNDGETISLKLVVPIEDGQTKPYDFSASGNSKYITSLDISCHPATIYNSTNVTLTQDAHDPNKTYTETQITDSGDYSGVDLGPYNLYRLRIDDDYLQFNDVKHQSATYINTYTIGIAGYHASENHNEWGNVYDLTDHNKLGRQIYTAKLYMDYGTDTGTNYVAPWGYFTTPVAQGAGEYIFMRSNATIHTTLWSDHLLANDVNYDAHDQFGTPITITIQTNAGYPQLKKVSQPSF